MSKPIVYIASPYTKGDPAINTYCQMRAFHELMDDGLVWPVVPLMSHFLHLARPRPYQDWIDYDLALLDRYDACLRINAKYGAMDYLVTESSGADGEVKRFREAGKPVFYSKEALYRWVRKPIIGLVGYARSGKNAAAEALVEDGWSQVAIADSIRESLLALDPEIHTRYGVCKLSVLVSEDGWEAAKAEPNVREMLQRIGMDASRNIHGEDCWIKLAKRKIDAANCPVVVTDVRFPNEAAAIREWGGKVIRITRTGVGPVNGHSSEAQDFDADIGIDNDGTIEDLHRAIRSVAARFTAELDERTPLPPATATPAPKGLPLCQGGALPDCCGEVVAAGHGTCGGM